ncbi:hypothetical protein CHU93_01695 [Sandarakinorhabdus cyanobacteriorum]|uniref:DUF2314 domain-containing protein n=2 Tax=Sandarakinorhabdus cyanobacteriorum TaxID=1981098 RepID=A0A255Z3D7_9SPHN|nr:hypothetical protein CHU93_01695 [Sandarakinorhabdus cyanobacteriorum]
MTMFAILGLALVAAFLLLRRWFGPPRGVHFAPDDPQLLAAKARARDGMPDFWAALIAADPADTDFMIKFNLHHGRAGAAPESIWARAIERRDGAIHGRLANPPLDPAWNEGDAVVIDPAAIDDWCFFRNNVAIGHFITRVMIERSAPHHAAQARKALGW